MKCAAHDALVMEIRVVKWLLAAGVLTNIGGVVAIYLK